MAREIVYVNDEGGDLNETPEQRFERIRKWVISKIKAVPAMMWELWGRGYERRSMNVLKEARDYIRRTLYISSRPKTSSRAWMRS